ncbi:glutamate receptor ionotropic, kainate 2-like [Contarinia nasturtii]|uniref:glutamate receptor ionotropic, kainate 2-like n=1 Tax=Contarinia nasturtii TaxID=265458 RepID=UPI0012D41F34|nr:glutamate receptor ionotropic, kainate 2-like [Contarinia nasturtii]
MRFSLIFAISVLHIFEIASTQQYKYINIGGIFPKNNNELVESFENIAKTKNTFSETVKLETIISTVDINDSIQVQKAVCDMADQNVAAIFGPNSLKTSGLVASICKKLRIPHFTAFFQPIEIDNFNRTNSYTRNLFPHAKKFSEAMMEIVKSLRWTKFAIIYDSEGSLEKFQDTFNDIARLDTTGDPSIAVYKLPTDSDNYEPLLKSISKSGHNRIIIECTMEHTYSILKQSSKVGMMSEYVSYFITGIDGYLLDLMPLPDVSANITTIRFINPTNADIYEYEIKPYFVRNRNYKPMFNPYSMTTETALMQDAVTVFSEAFGDNRTFIEQFNMSPTSCYATYDENQSDNDSGRDILNKVDENTVRGLTEEIHFNEDGQRDLFYIEVLQLSRNESSDNYNNYKNIAVYDSRNYNVTLLRNSTTVAEETTLSMVGRELKVIIRNEEPFARKRQGLIQAANASDIDLYEGFALELIKNISEKCGFRYTVSVVNMPSGKIENNEWNGIVREIIEKRADFAIGDITVTSDRKHVMDFSQPFMTLGISILYANPNKQEPGPFSFMEPLSTNVWFTVATAFLCISIIEYLLAKMAANDWENPHPCDENPEELENIWNMHNCIWLTVGSIMQQGCDILPKGVPTRLAVAVWWFFALIVSSSYTANLAAFLTKVQMEESISGVEDLAKQSKIQYGLVRDGTTEAFFKYSEYPTYQKMWSVMEKDPSVFVKSNKEGVQRVKNGNKNYAFFMESAPIKYEVQRDKERLVQIGDLLDSKEYSIGMPLNSPYRDPISREILLLKESGNIDALIEKWWENKKDETNKDNKEPSDTPELDVKELRGIFMVLGVGLLLSIFVGILEFIWSVRRTAIDERITPYEAFKKELKFAVSVWKVRKPVARMSSRSSTETLTRSYKSNDENDEDVPLSSLKSVKQNGFN